jgi:hypothetical protein
MLWNSLVCLGRLNSKLLFMERLWYKTWENWTFQFIKIFKTKIIIKSNFQKFGKKEEKKFNLCQNGKGTTTTTTVRSSSREGC